MAHLSGETVAAVMSDPTFRALVKSRARLRWSLSAATFSVFFGFVLLISARTPIFGIEADATAVPRGIVAIGIMDAVLVLLAAVYVYRSNTLLDALTAELTRKFGK